MCKNVENTKNWWNFDEKLIQITHDCSRVSNVVDTSVRIELIVQHLGVEVWWNFDENWWKFDQK